MSALTLAGILLAHAWGDYILQSDWMAEQKMVQWRAAILHGIFYTLPYVAVTRSIPALLVIGLTHIVIDHYRLARHLVWVKEQVLNPPWYRYSWASAGPTGYARRKQPLMASWLMIVADNTLHLTINVLAIWLLGGLW